MKKTLVILLVIFFVIVAMITIVTKANQDDKKVIQQDNKQYEQYLGKIVYGTDIATVINKAIDNNKKYNIQQDNNGYYINDDKYCVKIELNMITIEKTFQMEQIYNAGLTEFVKNFNLVTFKCNNIEYHNKTGRVSKIIFDQLEE